MKKRHDTRGNQIDRRRTLGLLGGVAGAVGLGLLTGCGDEASAGTGEASAGGGGAGQGGSAGGNAGQGGASAAGAGGQAGSEAAGQGGSEAGGQGGSAQSGSGQGGGGGASGSSGQQGAGQGGAGGDTGGDAWATGGTASMKGGYPDPFASGVGESCKLYCATTLGPCYVASPERKDVSEGHPGLPVRLVFLVVDESCKPIPGATVDIWHTAPEGLYSGNDAIDFCTGGDAKAKAARWFRGVQTADAGGRVEFDTCYPGWYPGRTIHIHFTVRVGGVEHATSQLIFDDALNDDILTTQPLYKDRGPRDTTNASDGILNSPAYMMQTQKMPDGALLAWKALVIRASLDKPLCQG